MMPSYRFTGLASAGRWQAAENQCCGGNLQKAAAGVGVWSVGPVQGLKRRAVSSQASAWAHFGNGCTRRVEKWNIADCSDRGHGARQRELRSTMTSQSLISCPGSNQRIVLAARRRPVHRKHLDEIYHLLFPLRPSPSFGGDRRDGRARCRHIAMRDPAASTCSIIHQWKEDGTSNSAMQASIT
jgi:hypothetical protein